VLAKVTHPHLFNIVALNEHARIQRGGKEGDIMHTQSDWRLRGQAAAGAYWRDLSGETTVKWSHRVGPAGAHGVEKL